MIWRRLQIDGNTSIADLYYIIQIAMGWDDDYLHHFHIHGIDSGLSRAGCDSFRQDADWFRRKQFDSREMQKVGFQLTQLKRKTVLWAIEHRPYPDLVARIREDTPLNAPDIDTFYVSGAKGHTSYPTLVASKEKLL